MILFAEAKAPASYEVNVMKNLLLCGAALMLTACSTSQIIAVGPQSYTLSATRCGICEPVSGYVTEQASNYCMAQHRFLIVRNIDGNHLQPWAPGSATINFSCVTENDPEYVRPDMRHGDGVITVTH
jgi:hypothetical protein